jgi:hypothetical protein
MSIKNIVNPPGTYNLYGENINGITGNFDQLTLSNNINQIVFDNAPQTTTISVQNPSMNEVLTLKSINASMGFIATAAATILAPTQQATLDSQVFTPSITFYVGSGTLSSSQAGFFRIGDKKIYYYSLNFTAVTSSVSSKVVAITYNDITSQTNTNIPAICSAVVRDSSSNIINVNGIQTSLTGSLSNNVTTYISLSSDFTGGSFVLTSIIISP